MFLLIFTIFLGRFTFQIKSNQRKFSVPFSFGFRSGGKYSINIKNNEEDNFIFLIATKDDMDKFMKEQNLYNPCNVTVPIDYYNITQINNSNTKITGSITKSGNYNTTVLSCEYFHKDFSFELIYNNPNSCLSTIVQNTLITNPIIALISLLLFILWIINWFKNFTLKNVTHTIFTVSFCFYVLQKMFYIFETIEKNKSDNPSHYQKYREMFQFLSLTYILTSFLIIANQFFYHFFLKFKIFILFVSVIVSYNLAKCMMSIDYFDDSDDFDLKSFVTLLLWESFLIFGTLFTCFVNFGNLRCCFTILMLFAAISYVLFYVIYSALSTFLVDYYIVVIIDIINIAFLSTFGFIFRLTPSTRNNYLSLQFEDDEYSN